MEIDNTLAAEDLEPLLERLWEVSGPKIRWLCDHYPPEQGSPVFTEAGRYRAKGWTEWTQGFLYGWAILQFDATGDRACLEAGRRGTLEHMASHVSHIGVHDHGFNNVSTYGNLRRLMLEGRIEHDDWELAFYELALKASGAVQAARWQQTADGGGYIYTFNGPHSLFVDTMRSLRSLALAHRLGHRLMGENDEAISLLARAVQHAMTTATYSVYYGQGRDIYDVAGRTAHEALFNVNDGQYRCPSTQQGYSPFSTWTRGLAWVMLGFAEQLEFLATVPDAELDDLGGRAAIESRMRRAASVACDFYLASTPADGIPYWDSAAPGLVALGDYLARPADPFNEHEPVDSSAAAIGAQGLLRFGHLVATSDPDGGARYRQAGLTILRRLLQEPYLSLDPDHQGLLLHGVYHRPGGWDHIASSRTVPSGESVMWGDYHLAELGLYAQRLLRGEPYYTFFGPQEDHHE